MTASCFGLGATLSNFCGQIVVEKFGHTASLAASFFISLVPIVLFSFMPETLGLRSNYKQRYQQPAKLKDPNCYSAIVWGCHRAQKLRLFSVEKYVLIVKWIKAWSFHLILDMFSQSLIKSNNNNNNNTYSVTTTYIWDHALTLV